MTRSQQLLLLIEQNYNRIIIGLAVIFFMIMITGIREFLNYSVIIEATEDTKIQQDYRNDKIAFEKNFLLPYLQSDTAKYFFAHENGALFEGEKIVQFRTEDESLVLEQIEQAASIEEIPITPRESWHLYWKDLTSPRRDD